MEGRFPVTLGGETVGSVLVQPQGLYQYYVCRCDLSGEVMMDLYLQTGQEEKKLGLLTPCSGGFGLDRRISGGSVMQEARFFLRPRRSVGNGNFCPVSEQEPFAYLQKLERGFLTIQNGQIGLVLQEEK